MKNKISQVTMKDIFTHREFLLMWSAMLLSTIGTFLLLLVLAADIFTNGESSLKAGTVFAAQWILPIFLFPLIGIITSFGKINKTLLINELLAGAISILIGFFYQSSFIGILSLLAIRGLFEAISKTGREVAFKTYIPDELQKKASALLESSYYLGTGIGGILGALLVNYIDFKSIAIIDCGTFLISGICYYLLQKGPSVKPVPTKHKEWKKGITEIKDNKILARTFFFLLLNVVLFQGLHNVARTVLPMGQLDLGVKGTQYLQMIFCGAITLSTFIFARYFVNDKDKGILSTLRIISTGLFAYFAVSTQNVFASFSLYFLFASMFEISFLRHKTDMRLTCHKDNIGHVSALFLALAQGGMILTILLFGGLTDLIGLQQSTLILISLAIIISYVIHYSYKEKYSSEIIIAKEVL